MKLKAALLNQGMKKISYKSQILVDTGFYDFYRTHLTSILVWALRRLAARVSNCLGDGFLLGRQDSGLVES
jgi:hypothetical protein